MVVTPRFSPGHLFQLIRSGEARTRKDLVEVTGLARSTISDRVDQLVAAGYLRESGAEVSTGGRPPATLSVDESAFVVLVADVDLAGCRVAVCDLGGRPLAQQTLRLPVDEGPEPTLAAVTKLFESLLEEAGRRPDELCGIGLGLPGPVNFRSGRLVQPPMMPGWHDYPVPEQLTDRFGVPVFVDNDANLMALGEYVVSFPSCPSLLLLKVGIGIGAGVVINGRVYQGIDGAAGGIGHVRLYDAKKLCACGATGCLAAVASGAALLRRLAEEGLDVVQIDDLVALLGKGNPEAVAMAREAGRHVGEVLSTVVSLLNPGVVLVGGEIALAHEQFITGVREVVYHRSLPRAIQALHLAVSPLGARAGMVGAAMMVIEQVFSTETVDARLAAEPMRAKRRRATR